MFIIFQQIINKLMLSTKSFYVISKWEDLKRQINEEKIMIAFFKE